ncbi:MAG: PorP/SprF family type IX secretion system membrane protein [Bacteroidales bacterium]|jgi:type IX secretion system PorP/SprF family membrane protein|nr:PorP/SprF family type IX secretion system membrane protein [Bacteroidales bacterium]
MIRKITYYLLGLGCLLIGSKAVGQQFPMTDHYLINPYSISPATAGSRDNAAFFFNYRKDWFDFGSGSPETLRFNTYFHLGNNMYLGGEAFMDKVDIFQRFKGALSYTYRLQIAEEQYLSFGLWGSVYQNTLNASDINGNINDPLFRSLDVLTKMNYNAGFGLVYYNRAFEVGIGMPTLLRTKDAYLMQSQGNFAFEQELLFHIGNTFALSPTLELMPYAVVRRTLHQPTIVDVSATFIFDKKFWISGLYRNSQVLALGVGGELFNSLNLHYSYEIGLGGMYDNSGGSHEITLGFRFGQINNDNTRATKQPRQKQKNRRYMLHDYQQLYEQKYRRD